MATNYLAEAQSRNTVSLYRGHEPLSAHPIQRVRKIVADVARWLKSLWSHPWAMRGAGRGHSLHHPEGLE